MRTDQLRPFATTAVAALLAACVWHVVPNWSVAVGSAVALVATVRLAQVQLVVERRRRRSSTRILFGIAVHVIDGSTDACTAGPLRPRIFLGSHLLRLLDDDELRAVVLHERAHQLGLDPLRASIVRAAHRLLPAALGRSEAVAHQTARREIRADTAALRRGASRRALAAALLKVPPAAPATVGFAPATELRVRALLGDDAHAGLGERRWIGGGAGVLFGSVACVWGLHTLLLAAPLGCCA